MAVGWIVMRRVLHEGGIYTWEPIRTGGFGATAKLYTTQRRAWAATKKLLGVRVFPVSVDPGE